MEFNAFHSFLVTSIGFTWTLGLSFGQTIYCILYIVFFDFIFIGIVVTTFTWFFTNRYLRGSSTDADIEWGYCFDVHLNAFFPPLVLLHFVQLIFFNSKPDSSRHFAIWVFSDYYHFSFSGLINSESFFSRFFGNTIWLIAIFYYIYITFLGYNCEFKLKANYSAN